jgi:hypothetical protein
MESLPPPGVQGPVFGMTRFPSKCVCCSNASYGPTVFDQTIVVNGHFASGTGNEKKIPATLG